MKLIESHKRDRHTQLSLPRVLKLRLSEIVEIDDRNETIGALRKAAKRKGQCLRREWQKYRTTKYSCHKTKKYLCLEHVVPCCNNFLTVQEQ